MPNFIEKSLNSDWLWIIVRCFIVILFLSSGLAKVFDPTQGFKEMTAAGLAPAWFFNYASAFILLFGAFLILIDRYVWIGCIALSIFLLLTIVIVHTFWNMPEPNATISMYFAIEHIAVIGGLVAITMTSHFRQQLKRLGVI